MTPFTATVIGIIRSIPEGQVSTYGGVAKAAGSPRGARQVVRILHSMSSSHGLPWHRVLNSQGRISLPEGDGGEFQRLLLEGEGVEFGLGGSVNLSRFGYFPEEDELAGLTEDI